MALSELSKLQVIQKRQEQTAKKLNPEPENVPIKKKKSIFAPDDAEAVTDEKYIP